MLRNWVTMLFTPDSVNAGDFGSLINNAISFYLLVFAGLSNLWFVTWATCCISALIQQAAVVGDIWPLTQ